ncbi:MAG: hypothetical protein ABIR68_17580 [Ilumatobacteraceae bacterium]
MSNRTLFAPTTPPSPDHSSGHSADRGTDQAADAADRGPGQPARPRRTRVTRELLIEGERAESLWEMYREAFEPLELVAIQQHLWSRKEILEELANEEIVKFIGWDDDIPVGMAMLTNNLEVVPMISPLFLRTRFPEHAERNAIFYGIMIFVRHGHRGKTLFARLGSHVAQETALSSGVVLFDICSYNLEHGSLDKNLGRLARPFPNSSMSMVDQQSWFAVELPAPLDDFADTAKRSR